MSADILNQVRQEVAEARATGDPKARPSDARQVDRRDRLPSPQGPDYSRRRRTASWRTRAATSAHRATSVRRISAA